MRALIPALARDTKAPFLRFPKCLSVVQGLPGDSEIREVDSRREQLGAVEHLW
jgi:hypothetical protein